MNTNLIILILAIFFNACAKDNDGSHESIAAQSAEAKDVKEPAEEVAVEPTEKDDTPLQANEWLDPITEKRWLLGAISTYEVAEKSCTGKYRLATAEEGIIATNHGLMTIAKELNLTTEFWIKANGADKAYVNTSAVRVQNNLPEAGASIFCIRE